MLKMKEKLTIEEAREIIDVSRSKIDSFVMSGGLPARKNGRSWVIKRKDLENIKKCKLCMRISHLGDFLKDKDVCVFCDTRMKKRQAAKSR